MSRQKQKRTHRIQKFKNFMNSIDTGSIINTFSPKKYSENYEKIIILTKLEEIINGKFGLCFITKILWLKNQKIFPLCIYPSEKIEILTRNTNNKW